MSEAHRSHAWRKLARARVNLARINDEPCNLCGHPIDYTLHGNHRDAPTADHPHQLQLGGDLLPPINELRIAHRHCNTRAGTRVQAKLRTRNKNSRPRAVLQQESTTSAQLAGFFPSATTTSSRTSRRKPSRTVPGRPRWWPDELASPPDNATLPRLETPHHSRAVGTYGPLVAKHARSYGVELWWWQAYVMHRLLEHDAEGRLLWAEAAVSVARQLGKGYGGIRPLCEWRMAAADLFGEPQTVLHLGHQVNVVMEIATPAIAYHRDRGDRVRLVNGEQSIQLEDGSRWLMRSTTGAYGFSVSMPVVDEVWAIAPRAIDSMVVPTMAARAQPQMVMWSTANANPTPTYPSFVGSAGEEEDRLVLEWSPDPDAARESMGDRRLWRMASPAWSDQRERIMARQLAKAQATRGDFLANWLNVWPELGSGAQLERAMPGWDALRTAPPAPARGGIVAVDEARDGSHFGVLRLVADCVYYREVLSLEEAAGLANLADHVIVGISLVDAVVRAGLRHRPHKYGSRQTASASKLLGQVVRSGRLSHDFVPEMLDQAAGAVLVETEGGKVLSAKRSTADVLGPKLLAWALELERSVASVRPAVW